MTPQSAIDSISPSCPCRRPFSKSFVTALARSSPTGAKRSAREARERSWARPGPRNTSAIPGHGTAVLAVRRSYRV